jgi:hypothetical protein
MLGIKIFCINRPRVFTQANSTGGLNGAKHDLLPDAEDRSHGNQGWTERIEVWRLESRRAEALTKVKAGSRLVSIAAYFNLNSLKKYIKTSNTYCLTFRFFTFSTGKLLIRTAAGDFESEHLQYFRM